MNAVVQLVKNSKIFKKVFHSALLRPSLYSTNHPKQFLLEQIRDGQFNRYDTIVRLLAIEETYGKNDYGWDLYLKMQQVRQAFANKHIKELDVFKNDFLALIKSVEAKGFDKKYPIMTNSQGALADGSHRLACALYFNIEEVKFKRDKSDQGNVFYGLKWFEENGFTKEEIQHLQSRFERIQTQDKTEFMALLWSPAVAFKEEIINDIRKYHRIIEIQDLNFDNPIAYRYFVKGMYAIDDIADWKIDKKLEFMASYPTATTMILFEMDFPNYRKKKLNGKPLSCNVEALKKEIRSKYSKRIDNYFYDIILHIGDNATHTVHMNKILEKDLAIEEYLQNIKNYNYVALKTDTPYQPEDFPKNYPLGKDLDLLVTKEDYEKVLEATNTFKKNYYKKYDIKTIKKENGTKIRFELNGFLCYQIDLSYSIFKINEKKVPSFLENRITNGTYFTLEREKELLVRCWEYLENPKKQHHLDYIEQNKSQINWNLLEEHLAVAEVEIIKKKI